MTDDHKKAQSNSHTSIAHLLDKDKKQVGTVLSTPSFSKEGEPSRADTPELPGTPESVVASEEEPTIKDKELEKYLEVQNDEPTIHPDLKKAGLQAIDTVSLDPKHRVNIPITDEEVFEGLKQPISSSFRWLAEFALFILKRGHLNLKKLHGHVVRVIQR